MVRTTGLLMPYEVDLKISYFVALVTGFQVMVKLVTAPLPLNAEAMNDTSPTCLGWVAAWAGWVKMRASAVTHARTTPPSRVVMIAAYVLVE